MTPAGGARRRGGCDLVEKSNFFRISSLLSDTGVLGPLFRVDSEKNIKKKFWCVFHGKNDEKRRKFSEISGIFFLEIFQKKNVIHFFFHIGNRDVAHPGVCVAVLNCSYPVPKVQFMQTVSPKDNYPEIDRCL